MSILWGIDLGGTKIEGVIIDSTHPDRPLSRVRIATEACNGYDHIIDRIGHVLDELRIESGLPIPHRIGIGTPGTLDPSTGRMKNANTTALNNRALGADLQQRFQRTFILANDANCFALAEAQMGAGIGASVVFGVILGTGVGGGLVVDGKVLNGKHGIAGEWGHNELDPNGEPCYCGRRGCVETVLSGPALERYYASKAGIGLPLREVMARVEIDDAAMETKARLIALFGKAIAPIINVVDPEAIILGGGVGSVESLAEASSSACSPYVFNPVVSTRFLRPVLGDSAGVFGAAFLTV